MNKYLSILGILRYGVAMLIGVKVDIVLGCRYGGIYVCQSRYTLHHVQLQLNV